MYANKFQKISTTFQPLIGADENFASQKKRMLNGFSSEISGRFGNTGSAKTIFSAYR
jgi:hypothetical protein